MYLKCFIFSLFFSFGIVIACAGCDVAEKQPDFSDGGGGSWSLAQSNNLETCAAKNYGDSCYVVHKFGVNNAGTSVISANFDLLLIKS